MDQLLFDRIVNFYVSEATPDKSKAQEILLRLLPFLAKINIILDKDRLLLLSEGLE
jgi:hypothetical protein